MKKNEYISLFEKIQKSLTCRNCVYRNRNPFATGVYDNCLYPDEPPCLFVPESDLVDDEEYDESYVDDNFIDCSCIDDFFN